MKTFKIEPQYQPEFDRKLISSLPNNGPRYTSYPTADRFNDTFGEEQYIQALEMRSAVTQNKPLSLYLHIPFCNTICYYCGCNKIITKDKSKADVYINYLEKELNLIAPYFKGKHEVAQLHFGGGTPTFLNNDQLTRVFTLIKNHFKLTDQGEYSIEIDPRNVSKDTITELAQLGFNRMSLGIQDFDLNVQQAVNRVQSIEETKEIILAARKSGFKSISVDLIYGLPHQTIKSFQPTLETIIALDPDRIALYHYAHLPHIFKPQRRIDTNVVPNSEEKMDILQFSVDKLTSNNYEFIGMDHFAKPTDELSIALKEGRLQRNFQGYSTYADCDLISIGVSSIGKVGTTYSQNERDINSYYAAIDNGHLPIMRGYQLNKDDLLRRNIIQDLMCRFALDYKIYTDELNMPFIQYFHEEFEDLKKLEVLELLKLSDNGLTVTPKGRYVIRNIAMIFDYYLRHKTTQSQYSKTI